VIFFIYVYRERAIGDFAEHKKGRPVYVGSTNNPKARYYSHLHESIKSPFQRELKRRGKDAFSFEIVEAFVGEPDDVAARENQWMNLLGTVEHGFNRMPAGRRPHRRTLQEEWKEHHAYAP